MRIIAALRPTWVLAVLALLPTAAVRADGPPAPADLVQAELVAENASISADATFWVDVHFAIKPGWHIYWLNPGDSGLPTTIDWDLPPGFVAGRIQWPGPEHFVQNGIGNYGYAGSADLLVPITAPAQLAAGQSVRLKAQASWLACADICIPGGANLALSLPVAPPPAALDPKTAGFFAAARSKLPVPAAFETRFAEEGNVFRLLVPSAALNGLHDPTAAFFPTDPALIDAAAEPHLDRRADAVELVLPKASAAAVTPATLDGVLSLHGADGAERAFEISANPAPLPPPANGVPWWQAILLAFLGGVVLNAMPCVFPILSLKLLSLTQQAHAHRSRRVSQGLAYTAGVLASFAALGGGLLALRAGGSAIGWGFQLQSPVFVAVLAYLLFAMGLSLSGVAGFGTSLAGIGGRSAARSGVAGTFFTGVLATVVATPCTAPFMGAALGFALIAPAMVAFGVFLALGFGLATPFLLASLSPGWRRVLPKPGAWMEFAKQLLAFPLYGTVAWLLWVLIQEVGPGEAFGALFGLVLVAFAMWVWGRTRPTAALGRRLGAGLAAVGAITAVLLAASLTAAGGSAVSPRDELAYEPFTQQRLSTLQAEGKPVFVDLTAAWCVTCLVNEHVALDSEAVRHAFAERGVVALKGDWTSQNPEITDFLQRFGRSGVPLYLFYRGKSEPLVLPQILTAATVVDAVNGPGKG
jgi:thiol:disulfide interchange protein